MTSAEIAVAGKAEAPVRVIDATGRLLPPRRSFAVLPEPLRLPRPDSPLPTVGFALAGFVLAAPMFWLAVLGSVIAVPLCAVVFVCWLAAFAVLPGNR
jgi:hypothetical protein